MTDTRDPRLLDADELAEMHELVTNLTVYLRTDGQLREEHAITALQIIASLWQHKAAQAAENARLRTDRATAIATIRAMAIKAKAEPHMIDAEFAQRATELIEFLEDENRQEAPDAHE